MKTSETLILVLTVVLFSGCVSMQQRSPVMATAEYAAKEPITTSLFPSDHAVLGDEAIARILSSKLELPAKGKLALMRFPDGDRWGSRYYGSYYWRDEDFVKLQQVQVETLSKALLASEQILEVAAEELVGFVKAVPRKAG